MAEARAPLVSIVIPLLNKLAFTRQCLDRIRQHTGDVAWEVIFVDNGSTDGTQEWASALAASTPSVRYHRNPVNLGFSKANNIGSELARADQLLFLNNDTLARPGWLSGMLRLMQSERSIGIVGIKQLFPYTNVVYHTGVVFAPGGVPQHLYPHLDATLPHVNQERPYQAVTGACLMIPRALFDEVGKFDEGYVNGYEDTDLCMRVARAGRRIVCCTSSFIYHYGQISEGRTAHDDRNAARFAEKWGGQIRADQDDYLARDRARFGPPGPIAQRLPQDLADDCVYFADDLQDGSAQTWVVADLALALRELGVPVLVNGAGLSPTLPAESRKQLERLACSRQPVGGVQIRWSHYRPRHFHRDLAGRLNLEFFVVNYLFGAPNAEPWDYWLQSVRADGHGKLPVSGFCKAVLQQIGVPADVCHVVPHGYSREAASSEPRERRDSRFRFLTVTNSHDLERYNTEAIITAFDEAFGAADDVTLVIKDYGASSGDRTLQARLAARRGGARVEYLTEFTEKRELLRLYRSADAFVSAHRGEGFGMKILDAMACGLPVITPLFGGPTEYCTPENSMAVEFSLVPMRDCLDTRALAITNQPIWAEVTAASLLDQMRRARESHEASAALGARARQDVIDRFTWTRAAEALLAAIDRSRAARPGGVAIKRPAAAPSERSPYWLGLRLSVIVPTRDRRAKLAACLDALSQQSILPSEFEVIVVDDGSTDGTTEWLAGRSYPFRLRSFRQEGRGPGAARNLGVEHAEGELVMFIGDDIYADERLLEEHLLAHAANPGQSVAILGHIDWARGLEPGAVMDYVCGDAMLQFAYTYIPTAPALDHRFFYTSNISLKRGFLDAAATDGIRFDASFHAAAFEDSEFAYRLMPRGLDIRYNPAARAFHDHPMDLESFSRREFAAGQMAVVFYRKHPAEDPQLQVQWIADLVEPAGRLVAEPALLDQFERFDAQTDALLRATAESLETMLRMPRESAATVMRSVDTSRLRAGLHNVLRVAFDVQRTRGKVQEWYASVDDPATVRAAQALACVSRKVEFLGTTSASVAGLSHDRVADNENGRPRRLWHRVRPLVIRPGIQSRLVAVDRRIQATLQPANRRAWLTRYMDLRGRVRRALSI